MVFKGVPMCSFGSDLFKAWFAQNGGIIGSALRILGGSNSPDLLTTTVNKKGEEKTSFNTPKLSDVANNTFHELENLREHSKMPVQMVGNNNSDMPYFNGIHTFLFTNMRIRKEYAIRIDRYFDMYGYAYNTVDDVDYTARNVWNYIKTIGLNIEASIPEYFLKQIVSIFENGIRFWKNPEAVGKYLTYADANTVGA